uniref:ShTK domain-containing family protein n=1 Tax=Rhizophora mucronata TaxID=61149 RepID=A0A2P2L8H4_RHIMU
MASLVFILFFAALTVSQFSNCFADSSRKGLRNNQVNRETIVQVARVIPPNRIDPSRVVQLSWRPRVFLYEGFLTDDECDYLVSLAQGSKEASAEYDDSGKVVNHRLLATSESLSNVDDEKLARIEERISAWTFLPKENSKPLQVMHYGLEDANSKFDYFGNKSSSNLREPLIATIILYLSNVTRGAKRQTMVRLHKQSHSSQTYQRECNLVFQCASQCIS